MNYSIHMLCLTLSLGLLGLAGSSAAWADRSDERGRRGPPQEAIEACDNGAEAAVCSFTSPRGDVLSGECRLKREAMVCVPEGHEKRRGGRAPRESEDSLE